MADQAELLAARPIRLATTTVSAAPTDGTTDPHVVLSPVAPSGLRTTGFFFGLKAPTASGVTAAVAAAGDFTVTVWIRDPVTKFWFSARARTGVAYGQAYMTFDLDACEIYFQIGNIGTNGSVDIHVSEL